MEERYLIDTSAVIKYLNETFPSSGIEFIDTILDQESIISFISEIELQVWNPINLDDQLIYKQFVLKSTILGLADGIVAETIRVRKAYNLKLPDALIAATCLINDFTLIADNDKDFKKVVHLKCINPNYLFE